jgi:hypothetical protein
VGAGQGENSGAACGQKQVKYRVSISPEVASEILSAEAFYDGIREGLGLEFEKEVESTLESIANNPKLYPRDFGDIRRGVGSTIQLAYLLHASRGRSSSRGHSGRAA